MTSRKATGPNTTEPTIRIFGSVGVGGPDGPISIGGPRQRRLLGLLAIRVGTVVDIDWLAEYLWHDEDRPDATDRAIRTYVSRLRQALPDPAQGWLETVPSGYRLAAPPDAVEHRRFALLRSSAAHARQVDDPLTALTLLDEALGLWRGDPFRELEDLDLARAEIEQLNLDRLEAQEERWEAALALGRHTQIVGELAAFTTEHQRRDRATRQLALALHRCGRTAEALRVIDDFRRRLADESGLEPSPGMVELESALLADDPSLLVEPTGRPLRGYRLLEEAGAGAFSIVWRGEQPSVQREVAIKQIRAELASQPEFIRRFEAEAHLVARLEHPHIVPLIDYWRDPDSAYLVMRWLPGGTLERRLDDGPLTLDETLTLARQIGGALSTAHARGIVHRDVKTANILFDDDGNAFLGDFGIALEATASDGPEAALSPGSPLYASPEQLRREPLGPESDVFSFGIVLYECLTGSLPFPVDGPADELVNRRLEGATQPTLEPRAGIPQEVSAAIAVATSAEPSTRFASVADFLDALGADVGTPAQAATSSPPIDVANPYVGLRAFDDGDADRFFGRHRLVRAITDQLAGNGVRSRCVTVVGPSGSGKSSVVRAGVIPAIRNGAIEGSGDWFVTTMLPRTDPYESLETSLLRIAVNPPTSLLEQLRDGPRGILRTIRRCLGSENDRLLLVIDQLEELFATADADAFLEALTVAVEDPTSPLRLITTLRADYYDRPLGHPSFAPILAAGAVDVVPLAGDEIEEAIVQPAEQLGVQFERGLVARISAESVSLPAPLPLLQYTLSQLFELRAPSTTVLTNDAFDELGGLSGALAARSEAIHEAASDDERTAIRDVFGRLADPTAAAVDLRRRVPLKDLGDDAPSNWVVEQFTAARLVTLDRDPSTREPTIEVAHEALFREWPRLVQWLDDDRELLRTTAAIGRAASDWDAGGRSEADLYRGERLASAVELDDERRRLRPVDNDFLDASQHASEAQRRAEESRIRRLRRLVAGTAAALVVALIAGGLAWRAQVRANEQAEAAEVATLISRSASLQDDERTQSLLLALEAHRRAPDSTSELALLDALSSDSEVSVTPSVALDPTGFPDCNGEITSSDGTRIFQVVDDRLVLYEIDSGMVVDLGPTPLPSPGGCGRWAADADLERRVVWGDVDTRSVGTVGTDDDIEIAIDTQMFLASPDIVGDRVVFVDVGSTPVSMVVIDAVTGGVIVEVEADYPTFGSDGTLLGFIKPLPDGSAEVIVIDAVNGDEIHRVAISAPSRNSVFDHDAGHLLVPAVNNELITIDLESGDVVATVPTTGTTEARAIGVRPDGLVVIGTEGQIEVVDRNVGPTGVAVPIRDVFRMRVRPDGSVLKVGNDGRTEIIDLGGGSPLVRQRWDVDPESLVNSNHGQAAAVNPRTGRIELVDLDSGDRTELMLDDPAWDGTPIVAAVPQPDGLLTFTDEGAIVARWSQDGTLIEAINMGRSDTSRSGGGSFGEQRGVAIIDGDDGTTEVSLVAIDGDLRVLMRLTADDVAAAFPSRDDGIHVIDTSGIFRSYDASGQLIDEIDTGVVDAFTNEVDESRGLFAVAGPRGGVIINPQTGEVEQFPTNGQPSSMELISDGELLLISSVDGNISVWDVERGELGGVIAAGSGSTGQGGSYFDQATGLLWVTASGELIGLEMTPERWIQLACAEAGRDFTVDEWDRLVPGDGPVQSACS